MTGPCKAGLMLILIGQQFRDGPLALWAAIAFGLGVAMIIASKEPRS